MGVLDLPLIDEHNDDILRDLFRVEELLLHADHEREGRLKSCGHGFGDQRHEDVHPYEGKEEAGQACGKGVEDGFVLGNEDNFLFKHHVHEEVDYKFSVQSSEDQLDISSFDVRHVHIHRAIEEQGV